jgi:hypothetical protein
LTKKLSETRNFSYAKRLANIKRKKMRQFLIILTILISSCKSQDYSVGLKVGEDLGGGGTIGFYRTEVDFSKIHNYKKYINLVLDNQGLFKTSDTSDVLRVAAYRTYRYLDKKDKRNYKVIQITIKNNLLSELDTTNFFKMEDLEKISNSEDIVRGYFRALINKDTTTINRYFDTSKFNYTMAKVDSINRFFRLKIKDTFDKSKLYNWRIIEDEGAKYKLLVFLTDTSNNYNVKFQFAMNDSIKGYKDIVSIKY